MAPSTDSQPGYKGYSPNANVGQASAKAVLPPSIVWALRLAKVLDASIEIPFTNVRIGLDPILGLYPPLGDLISALVGLAILAVGLYHRLPGDVIAKMAGNLLLDLAVGLVPFVGDFVDFMFKSHLRNANLLEEAYLKHLASPAEPKSAVVEAQAERIKSPSG